MRFAEKHKQKFRNVWVWTTYKVFAAVFYQVSIVRPGEIQKGQI